MSNNGNEQIFLLMEQAETLQRAAEEELKNLRLALGYLQNKAPKEIAAAVEKITTEKIANTTQKLTEAAAVANNAAEKSRAAADAGTVMSSLIVLGAGILGALIVFWSAQVSYHSMAEERAELQAEIVSRSETLRKANDWGVRFVPDGKKRYIQLSKKDKVGPVVTWSTGESGIEIVAK